MDAQIEALQGRERTLAAAARLADLGYWEIDAAGQRVSWSEESCRMLGVPLTERTRSWEDFVALVHVEDRATLEECRARMLRGEENSPVVFRLVRPDASVRYAKALGEPCRDQSGQTVRTVGAVQDISDRKHAERALHGSEERFRLALQATGLAPWDWDLTTNVVEFRPEWKRQLGYEPHEMPDRYEEWETRLHPDDRERVLEGLRAYLAGRRPEYALEFRLRHKNGTYRWIYTRGVVLRDASGRQTHMIGCHLDITERKQLEEQYRQAQKMQAVGQLAGGIAHDFNNLLVVIGGYAHLVAEELGPTHGLRRDIDEIRVAARSAADLTRQLLAFSRRQILQPQVLDLNHILQRMHHMLGRIIGEHIILTMRLSATARVLADPGQIDQVIMNLAVNARDAMPRGGRLLIETVDTDLDAAYVDRHPGASIGRHLMIAVSDTGAGMDEATRARVFEPFFTTKAAGHGTGLGLATVYGIVKQSEGSIWVYSEVGQGTTFKIYLPVTAGDLADGAPPGVDEHELQGTETVLVLEDQAEVRALIDKTLRHYGYSVIVAANGLEAIVAARAHNGPIHVLLTDVVLPRASGREIAREMVADRPSTRVLYMSGYTEDAIVQHGVLAAGLAFIEKPFAGETLLRRIREVLTAERAPLV